MTETGLLLTIDAGNSSLDCMRHDDGVRTALGSAAPMAAFADLVRAAAPARCVATSVVSPLRQQVAQVLADFGVPVRWAGQELPCPLRLDYDTPATLGADRWLGALAAYAEFGASVVVDCGTATTVNLVGGEGVFRGGAIGPGLAAFAAGMGAVTPALPAPDLDARTQVPSRSTQAAVDTGVLLGWCGLVERLVADTMAAAGGAAQLVVTGGNAERLLRRSHLQPVHIPDLVHRGLRRLDEQA